ncbi:sigma-70 family RNA polymerase sigma factor [Halosquirtibacter xylanolyticus]|uniref:sigma-70 family RNA polymerase sigma factor n=1 Tax=Halosquirtibacter xylanolyticus TaxID=3374599 RepID=UPI0037484C35|nr:sigma-70 family RNA polymerase sigma factor [Prolixibacteraceae bacterium]
MTTLEFKENLLELKENLYYFAMKLTSDPARAEDLLQDTFLKALTYRTKFKPDTNFKAWIFTIMKNSYINDFRRQTKRNNAFDQSNCLHIQIQEDFIYPSPESIEAEKEILKAIGSLDKVNSEPLMLFINGYHYHEISDILELPIGTIKSRIHFSRKKLEKLLADYKYRD